MEHSIALRRIDCMVVSGIRGQWRGGFDDTCPGRGVKRHGSFGGQAVRARHAPAMRTRLIRIENTNGAVKKNIHVMTLVAANASASVHNKGCICRTTSLGRLPTCHASAAASTRSTEQK